VADEWAPTGSRFPEPCPASGFTCPGRAGDTVNEVPGSKPIVVDSGQASEDQEVETITFGVVVDTTPEEYDEEAYIQMLAEHYGVDASLISVEATPVDDHRRRQLSHGGGGGLNLQVTIRVPDEETYSYEPPEQDGEEWQPDVVDTESGLTVGGTDGGGGGVVGPVLIAPSPPPRPSTAARLASRLAAIDTSGEGLAEAFTALGVNVTQATDLAITTVTVQVSVECPVRRAKLESSTTVADTPDLQAHACRRGTDGVLVLRRKSHCVHAGHVQQPHRPDRRGRVPALPAHVLLARGLHLPRRVRVRRGLLRRRNRRDGRRVLALPGRVGLQG